MDSLAETNVEFFSSACDLGTGSGILSIGLAKLGTKRIFAIDIDQNAVKAAWSNWQENDFSKDIKFTVEESGLDNQNCLKESYELAIANITFAVLSQNIRNLAKVNSKRFIFSGIITEKKDAFIELLQSHLPGNLLYSQEWNEWWVLDWQKY